MDPTALNICQGFNLKPIRITLFHALLWCHHFYSQLLTLF